MTHSRDPAFNQLLGQHTLPLDSIPVQEMEDLCNALEQGQSPQVIWDSQFQKNSDALARCAVRALRDKRIQQQQAATLLQLRQVHEIASSWRMRPLESKKSTNEDDDRLSFYFPDNLSPSNRIQEIKSLPPSEQYYFDITIDVSKIQDTRILKLLDAGHDLKIVYFQSQELEHLVKHLNPPYRPTSQMLRFSVLSAGAMELVTQLRFGKHAASAIPRLGKLRLEDIIQNAKDGTRYVAYSHPEVPVQTVFHDILAKPFYLTLHDEAHRQLISSFPNSVYKAFQRALQVVQNKTGFHLSKDLMNGFDAEINDFLKLKPRTRDTIASGFRTSEFCKLLCAKVFSTQEPLGLFSDDISDTDTCLLLMIDVHENPDVWSKLGIEPKHFPAYYRALYKQVSDQWDLIKNKNPATQVAILKQTKPTADEEKPCTAAFIKYKGYVQLQVNGKIQEPSKAKTNALVLYNNGRTALEHALSAIGNSDEFDPLCTQASAIMTAIDKENPASRSVDEIRFYQKCLTLTSHMLNPINQRSPRLQKKYQRLIWEGTRIHPKLAGLLSMFFGAVIAAISATATVASMGISTPLSAGGIALGSSMILAGVGLFRKLPTKKHSQAMLEFLKLAESMKSRRAITNVD